MEESKYRLVDSDSEQGEAATDFLYHTHRRRSWTVPDWLKLTWKRSTFLSAGVALALLVALLWPRGSPLGSYEDGFSTDMIFDDKIPLVKQRTHGRLRLYPNFTSYIAEPDLEARWPENLSYFGHPGKEEDKNWAVMMHDTHFSVTEEEAHRVWGDDYQKYYLEEAHGYQAELGVFHALHCLNWVRKALSPEEYPHVAEERVKRGDGHTSHCMDILRQHVQCYGSTTMIPSQHSEVLGRPYTDSDQMYTCRDFAYLRMWTDAKKNADRKRVCSNGGSSIWGTRCDGFPGPVDPALWTIH